MATDVFTKYDPIKYKTPTGTQLQCKGWVQEAALRMLLNNLDPDVAERPDDLIWQSLSASPRLRVIPFFCSRGDAETRRKRVAPAERRIVTPLSPHSLRVPARAPVPGRRNA